jgi:hypothetical protein
VNLLDLMLVIVLSGPASSGIKKVAMSSNSNPATHSEVARVSPVQSSKSSGKRKVSSATSQLDPEPAETPAKKAKSVDEVEREVRGVLGKKLFGQDDAVKVDAMRTLTEYFRKTGRSEEENQQNDGYRRAVGEWGGCRLVLLVLELELDKGDRANRDLVYGAMRFLLGWNYRSDERRNTMMRFKGISIVLRAIQAFSDDSVIQHVGITTFLNFTAGSDNKRCIEELVNENCIPLILRIITTRANAETLRKHAVVVLGRLCDVAGPACFEAHVDASTLGHLFDMFKVCKDSNDRCAEEVRKSCRALSSKMFE